MSRITNIRVLDIRAPTSRTLAGSDAVHTDPDYSAAYAILETDGAHVGHGFTFTIGRGNEVVCAAVNALAPLVAGRDLGEITGDFAAFHRRLTNESQLRWLGPEKGVIHLATAAIVNAVWDLWAKQRGVPVWKLVADFTPHELLGVVDWRYLSDALPREQALDFLQARAATKAVREKELRRDGVPAYITSAGWLGYPEEKVRRLCREALVAGWSSFKVKVGVDIPSDVRRCAIMREEIGWERDLMADANQAWDVPQAIEWMRHLAPFRLRWIEEPTSPDDVLGHAAIRRAITPVGVATGEHCANKVMFKQLLQAGAIDYCQVDACRLGGLNEVLAVLLLAAKYLVPVCPHAGGLGLCEYVQHIAIIDYLWAGASLADRATEFADHLHEHFIHPARVRAGRYVVPEAPGYSAEMRAESLAALSFPDGAEWRRA